MADKLTSIRKSLKDSVSDYSQSLLIDIQSFNPQVQDVIRNGQIQKFEVVIELVWKSLKVYLYEIHGVNTSSPKQVIRSAFEVDFLTEKEADKLLDGIDIRNQLSHIYKKSMFDDVYPESVSFVSIFNIVSKRIGIAD